MKFKVAGADKLSGQERTIEVDARDEVEADRKAGELGLFVASIAIERRPRVEPLDYSAVEAPSPSKRNARAWLKEQWLEFCKSERPSETSSRRRRSRWYNPSIGWRGSLLVVAIIVGLIWWWAVRAYRLTYELATRDLAPYFEVVDESRRMDGSIIRVGRSGVLKLTTTTRGDELLDAHISVVTLPADLAKLAGMGYGQTPSLTNANREQCRIAFTRLVRNVASWDMDSFEQTQWLDEACMHGANQYTWTLEEQLSDRVLYCNYANFEFVIGVRSK
jgi:hypothetical protein